MDQADRKLIRDFFSQYRVHPFDESAYLLTGSKEQILVRTHLIVEDDSQTFEEVTSLLDMHLSLDQQYVAPLLHFERCEEGVRAFYQMDRLTLKQQVHNRLECKQYFLEQQIWVLLSSLVDSLIYLQDKGVIYGILSSSKIFLQDQIRLMDPSAFNLAPMNISRLSYHSPEIRKSQTSIDFNVSDVFLLGLCILEAASLSPVNRDFNNQIKEKLIGEIGGRYSSQLVHVLNYLLREEPQSRPTLKDIKQYIQSQIQISSAKQWQAENLALDLQDQISLHPGVFSQEIEQIIDILQPLEAIRHDRRRSEYELARDQFLHSPLKANKRTMHSTYDNSKESRNSDTIMSRHFAKADENSIVEEFKLVIPETVSKNRKVSRAVEIKNRNAEQVKKIQSIRVQQQANSGTDAKLRSMIQVQTQRAKQYLQAQTHLR